MPTPVEPPPSSPSQSATPAPTATPRVSARDDEGLHHGSAWYLGAPGSGKTSLAWKHLEQLVRADLHPALVVDTLSDSRFADLPLARSVDECVDLLWTQRRSCRYVSTTDDNSDLDRLFAATLAGGCVHVLIDESAFYVNSRAGTNSPLTRLLRSYRHAAVTVQLTTQHPSGDVSQEALACSPVLHVFHSESPRALEMLERDFGLPRSDVLALPYPRRVEHGIVVTYYEVTPSAGHLLRTATIED